jgi:hypothetical protein
MKIVFLLAAALLASEVKAQFGPWPKPPTIVILAAEGDPRIALVDEAIAYWNRVFEEVGSPFRLPAATRNALPIPEHALHEMSDAIVSGRRPVPVPEALRSLPGDLTIALARELGHAIGLRHNADPAMLMCGRPAPCRPPDFASRRPHIFPLTEDERRALLRMYPPEPKL